ncbi:MAG TPA: hypothetical protein VFP81_06875 [Propionibacteriaceae bacterium]|nr:hypothetical protein [Propionibacteriaceae bacterium]
MIMAGELLREPDEPQASLERPGGPVQSNIPYGQAVNMIMERAYTKALSWSPSDRSPLITINLRSRGFTR